MESEDELGAGIGSTAGNVGTGAGTDAGTDAGTTSGAAPPVTPPITTSVEDAPDLSAPKTGGAIPPDPGTPPVVKPDHEYLQGDETKLPEKTKAEIIEGRKSLIANNHRAAKVAHARATEEDQRSPTNIVVRQGDDTTPSLKS